MATAKVVSNHPATKEPLIGLGKPYNGKVEHNVRSWGRILEALEKGPVTIETLQKACVYEHDKKTVNHKNFPAYMFRQGYLIKIK